MDKSGLAIVAVAIIWAAVILASAIVLQGTPQFGPMLPVLGGGAAATIVILGGTRRREGQP